MPWARPGSGFTLLFSRRWSWNLAKSQPIADIAAQVGEHDTRSGAVYRALRGRGAPVRNYTGVEKIGIDETSRKDHKYITMVADLAERNVVCVVPGKDSRTVERFARDFMAHNGDPNRVRLVTCDTSLGLTKDIRVVPEGLRT